MTGKRCCTSSPRTSGKRYWYEEFEITKNNDDEVDDKPQEFNLQVLFGQVQLLDFLGA